MDSNLNTYSQSRPVEAEALTRTFMSNVFSWMFFALAITALISYTASGSAEFIQLLINQETGSMSIFGWVIMLAPLGLVFWMSAGVNRMSATTLTLVFVGYSILMGLSLSFIFLMYTGASIAKTFVIAAGMFGLMAIVGYTTKTDLTRFGSLMIMGLIGILIASVVNFFLKSSTMDYIISFIGVLVFTGLTAYDVQKLKNMSQSVGEGTMLRKASIMGALTLYLDFINLFLFLLRFFGNRK